ncbi:MAG: ankyrin repeat domain-containing protein [Candidatus Micrarchaeota archaeon]|nr:ankyrin repeat domain-containing protein [Candidatus Micrarchaeota archaeon]
MQKYFGKQNRKDNNKNGESYKQTRKEEFVRFSNLDEKFAAAHLFYYKSKMIRAAIRGDIQTIKTLEKEGIAVDEQLLLWAITGSSEETVEYIAKKLSPNNPDPIKILQNALANNKINLYDREMVEYQTPLIKAIKNKNLKALKIFVEDLKADINDKRNIDGRGNSALMVAIALPSDPSKNKIIDYLLENKADVNMLNLYRMNALDIAVLADSIEIAEKLIKYGIDINSISMGGKTPLMHAAEIKKDRFVEFLASLKETDLNIQDGNGKTALMIALEKLDTKSAFILLKAGADVTLKDEEGKNALDYAKNSLAKAREKEDKEMIKQIETIIEFIENKERN